MLVVQTKNTTTVFFKSPDNSDFERNKNLNVEQILNTNKNFITGVKTPYILLTNI